MLKRTVSGIMLTLLLMSVLILAFNIQPVKAEVGIWIRPDGSVYPPTAPVTTSDNITYTFTGNIRDTVVIQRSNVTVDGAGYKLQGYGVVYGFDCRANNVTIKNTNIFNFSWGIILRTKTKYSTICRNNIASNGFGVWVVSSSNNTIFGNNITNNDLALALDRHSQSNVVYGNNLFLNVHGGVHIYAGASHNTVFGNNITSRARAIGISIGWYSHSNTIFGNHIVGNSGGVLVGLWSQNNVFYHNSFVDNIHQVIKYDDSANIWDDGYPSGGNYWSDYAGLDADRDGIGDTPYIIDQHNQDRYPLMKPWFPDNILPVANAGPDQTVYEDALVTFDGSGSSDNVGIVSYMWAFTDSTPQTLTGMNPTYIFATPGTYIVTLTVRDSAGNYATDTVTITVLSLSPKELIRELTETIETWNLPKGTQGGLTSKLEDASHLLDKGNENGAIHKMMDFINRVEAMRGKKITNEQAEYLIFKAQRIIDLIKA